MGSFDIEDRREKKKRGHFHQVYIEDTTINAYAKMTQMDETRRYVSTGVDLLSLTQTVGKIHSEPKCMWAH